MGEGPVPELLRAFVVDGIFLDWRLILVGLIVKGPRLNYLSASIISLG
jgi:hypothetical protein